MAAKVRVYSFQDIENSFPNNKIQSLDIENLDCLKFRCGWAFVFHQNNWLKCEADRNGNWNILSSKYGFPMKVGQDVILIPKNSKIKK